MSNMSTVSVRAAPELSTLEETRRFLEQQGRLAAYAPYLNAPLVRGFEIDKKELHVINAEAICFVYDAKTLRLTAVKALRVGQVLWYWGALPEGDESLRHLIKKGLRNSQSGLNNA